jgi:hypothetical protein
LLEEDEILRPKIEFALRAAEIKAPIRLELTFSILTPVTPTLGTAWRRLDADWSCVCMPPPH